MSMEINAPTHSHDVKMWDESGFKRVNRNITYRLLPVTRTKARQLEHLASACRFVWNYFLAEREATYQFNQCFEATYGIKPEPSSLSFYAMGKEFTKLRNRLPWLRALPFAPVRYVLKYQADT